IGYDVDRLSASDRRLLHDWYGLLDCAHYVSRCIQAGGVAVNTGYVPTLVDVLRGRNDTKTLGNLVPRDKAQHIIDTGGMQAGDAIAYAHAANNACHSPVSLGTGNTSCHTMSRSPKFDSAWFIHPTDYVYTLIHFTNDDIEPDPALKSALAGWWEVTWNG